MDNNNIQNNSQDNGRGIFYAVIGVATLVITIIGATFAYFAATTNSAANAISATGATISLEMGAVTTGIKDNLIPIDVNIKGGTPETELFNKGGYTLDNVTYKYAGIGANDCRDANGNNICSVYQFTVLNPSANTASQRVYGTMKVTKNQFANLKYAIFKGTAAEVAASTVGWNVDGTPVTAKMSTFTHSGTAFTYDWKTSNNMATTYTSFTNTTTAADAIRKNVIANRGDLVMTGAFSGATQDITLTPLEQILDVGEAMTYTVVVWIQETGSNQSSVDGQGKQFGASFHFTTEGDSTGVTGSLLVSA